MYDNNNDNDFTVIIEMNKNHISDVISNYYFQNQINKCYSTSYIPITQK